MFYWVFMFQRKRKKKVRFLFKVNNVGECPIASFEITFTHTGLKFSRALTIARPKTVTDLQQMVSIPSKI